MMMQARGLWEHRSDVLNTLAEMAARADYKAHNDRKLYLEMTGDYTPRSMVGVGKAGKGGEIEALSDEELRAWMGEQTADSQRPADDSQRESRPAVNDWDGLEGEDVG